MSAEKVMKEVPIIRVYFVFCRLSFNPLLIWSIYINFFRHHIIFSSRLSPGKKPLLNH